MSQFVLFTLPEIENLGMLSFLDFLLSTYCRSVGEQRRTMQYVGRPALHRCTHTQAGRRTHLLFGQREGQRLVG
jgi:hypothetical protein